LINLLSSKIMKTFNRNNKSGERKRDKEFGRRDYGGGGGRRFGGRSAEKPSMHEAICSDCGKECEVPFRPTGDRPIFCSSCFEKHGNVSASRSGGRSDERSDFRNKRMFEAVCDKCGNKCMVPFQPTSGKPVYCSQCFDRGGGVGGKSADQHKEQFEILNAKLDNILRILRPVVPVKAIREEVVIKKTGKTKKHKDNLTKTKAVSKKTKVKKKR